MIISVSRRSDIPALYSDWFFARLRAGSVLTRNPFNPRQATRVGLDPTNVDGLVFWSRNPAPMLSRLDALAGYAYYFHYTITAYGAEIEPACDTFRHLADAVGAECVIWRYDPIILTPKYNEDYHLKSFSRLAAILKGYTRKSIISFVTPYKKTLRNMAGFRLSAPDDARRRQLAGNLAAIAHDNGLRLLACCEPLDLKDQGISPSRCIDAGLLGQIAGRPFAAIPAKGQRPGCTCNHSIDIGAYNTCTHGCRYCYANASPELAQKNARRHDPGSETLLGDIDQAPDSQLRIF